MVTYKPAIGELTPNREFISGLQLTIPSRAKQGDYVVEGLNSNTVTLSISAKEEKGYISNNVVTVHIVFELREATIEKISVPYNEQNHELKDKKNIAFLGFKENQDVKNGKSEIDTKEMPLLLITPFFLEDDYKKKSQKNNGKDRVSEFALTPSIEDNDTNIKANFSFDTHIVIGDGEKLLPGLSIDSPGLLVNIASKTLGDLFVYGLDHKGEHTFKMETTATKNGKAVTLDLSFDLTDAKIIVDPDKDIDPNDYALLQQGQKAYLKFKDNDSGNKRIETKLTPVQDANAKINFSFLLVDSIMIGSANKLHGGAGRLIGSANKLHGGAANLPGS